MFSDNRFYLRKVIAGLTKQKIIEVIKTKNCSVGWVNKLVISGRGAAFVSQCIIIDWSSKQSMPWGIHEVIETMRLNSICYICQFSLIHAPIYIFGSFPIPQ